MRYLALDPGVCTGWAVFEDGPGRPPGLPTLYACGVAKEEDVDYEKMYLPHSSVIELPQIYSAKDSKGDPNVNIVPLILMVGRYQERLQGGGVHVELYLPREWKGQLDKAVHHPRIYGALSPKEQGIVAKAGNGIAPSLRHNMMDAVGLGQWACKHGKWVK